MHCPASPFSATGMFQIAGKAERQGALSVSREGGRRVALSVGSCLTLHLKTLTLGRVVTMCNQKSEGKEPGSTWQTRELPTCTCVRLRTVPQRGTWCLGQRRSLWAAWTWSTHALQGESSYPLPCNNQKHPTLSGPPQGCSPAPNNLS